MISLHVLPSLCCWVLLLAVPTRNRRRHISNRITASYAPPTIGSSTATSTAAAASAAASNRDQRQEGCEAAGAAPATKTEEAASLVASANELLPACGASNNGDAGETDVDAAFALLAKAHALDSGTPGLSTSFETYFETRIALAASASGVGTADPEDHLGLGSLRVDAGRYGEAAAQFRAAIDAMDRRRRSDNGDGDGDSALRGRAVSSLYKANAAVCYWKTVEEDSTALRESVLESLNSGRVPSVHPYEALMWPFLNIRDAARVASRYGARASGGAAAPEDPPMRQNEVPAIRVRGSGDSRSIGKRKKTGKIRVGYISNDFTGRHPLGMLMQDFFKMHDFDAFDVMVYSLNDDDGSREVRKIRDSATAWKVLRGMHPDEASNVIKGDGVDVLVDLTGYTGTSAGVEIVARKPAPVRIVHMGFPASTGAYPEVFDYLVCDETCVPPQLRHHYSENLLYMPHCFFSNSHRYLLHGNDDDEDDPPEALRREDYGLPAEDEGAFVYCCHNRAEKIDASTFRSWLRALEKSPKNSVLWLLRSSGSDDGATMERNLRQFAADEFGGIDRSRLVFCDKVDRDEHLRRLALADLFLDTPAYNSHTVGCDSLVVGVPMVSLLRDGPAPSGEVGTEKMPSRVGASFLRTLGLDDELVTSTMDEYEAIMVRCATDREWFAALTDRLRTSRDASPLFDTPRWVRNWEAALAELATNRDAVGSDICVIDDE